MRSVRYQTHMFDGVKTMKTVNLLLLIGCFAAITACGGGGGEPAPQAAAVVTTKTAYITVVPAGGGTFLVRGNDLDGVAGIDLVIRYSTPLANPTVSQGALIVGALFAANPNYAPGSIKIGVVSPSAFSGSGDIATITFRNWQSGAQSPTVSASFIDSKGASVSGGASGSNDSPSIPFGPPSATSAVPSFSEDN